MGHYTSYVHKFHFFVYACRETFTFSINKKKNEFLTGLHLLYNL